MSFAALGSELGSLSAEARRKYVDVREAADRAQSLCKSPEDALRDLQREDGPNSTVLSPILQGCQTKNAKIIVLSVACLQRLVAIRGAVTQYSASAILQNLRAVLNQGVEIQLKILQTLVALLQNGKDIHGQALAEALLLCFRLQESKVGQVASTAAGILRQLVIIIFDGVAAEDKRATDSDPMLAVMLPDGGMIELRPSACDAYHVFEDLCILVGATEGSKQTPHLLKLTQLPKALGIELIESILADFVRVFLAHTELIAVLRTLLAPLVLKGLSERPSPFSSMVRFMRLGFLLMSKYHAPLEAELEVLLHFYVRVIDGTGAVGAEETWTRVLALEVIRGICNDFELLLKVWRLYKDVLLGLLAALGKVATEKPALLGSTSSSHSTLGLVLPGGIAGDAVNSVLEMAAQAATSVGVLPNASGQTAGLYVETATVKQQCIDQLNKADPPATPETYPYYLALQCLSAVAAGFYSFVLSRIHKLNPPSPKPAFDFDAKEIAEPLRALKPVRDMVSAAWPALLSSLSFFMSTNLDDTLFSSTLVAQQSFTKTCGLLDLPTPRDAFLTSLCRFAIPQAAAEPTTLSERNLQCLKAVASVASSLAGSLGTAWLLVFEALQSAEGVLQKSTPEADLLFQKTKHLDEAGFAAFVAALCRLNGEVIGMPVTETGALDLEEAQSPLRSAPSPTKRRTVSTMTVKKTAKPGEQNLFGLTRLDEVATINLARLTSADAADAWEVVVSHLLAVAHWSAAAAPVRLQAANVLDQLLEQALKQAGDGIQSRILEALADQSEAEAGPQSATDIDIRRMGLETLFRILESAGHSFTGGWHSIFGILASACPGRLVKTAFPAIHLICTDFLSLLGPEEMRLCITTLADYGRQEDDVNIALTAGGLLWQVSDHLQSRRRGEQGEAANAFAELWMLLLHQLLSLCDDERQEVRDGAIQTIARSLELYGAVLPPNDWDVCIWQVVVPLLDSLDDAIRTLPIESAPAAPVRAATMTEALAQPRPGLSAKQWNDSKTLALSSFGGVLAEHLATLQKTTRFDETWSTILSRFRDAFLADHSSVAVAAMRSFARVVEAAPKEASELRDVAWQAWEQSAADVLAGGKATVYTQASLDALIAAMPKPIKLDRHARLLELLRGILVYSKSEDMRPDVDAPNPVQSAVLATIALVPVEDAQTASRQLSAYADIATLAFSDSAGPHATYVGLFKVVLPKAAALIDKWLSEHSILTSGAVAAFLRGLATPMRLKYKCPSAAKFGDDQDLWKTATEQFLLTARLCLRELSTRGGKLPESAFIEVHRCIIEACRGALLADSRPLLLQPLAEQRKVELLDLQLLTLLELDVIPQLGATILPDDLIALLADTLASAARLYTLDLPVLLTPPATPEDEHVESRFSYLYARQAQPNIFGTTAGIIEAPKERVAYWSFVLLVQMCQASDSNDRRRIAHIALPSLLNRCEACLRTYIVDRPLHGRMPFPRVREEEIVYVLDQLLRLRLDAAPSANGMPAPSTPSKAHLKRFHGLFVALLALPKPGVVLPPVIFDHDAEAEATAAGLPLGQVGRKGPDIDGGLPELAARCLYAVGE